MAKNCLKGILLFCLTILVFCEDPYEANPFYVDPTTVKKENAKWTMKLKNHHDVSQNKANPEILSAAVTFECLDERVMRFKMIDATTDRWEVKLANPNPGKGYIPAPIAEMGLKYSDDPFGFEIIDPTSQELVVSTLKPTNSSLKFYDKYLEFGEWFSSQKMYGLGERVTKEFQLCAGRDWCVYTTFNKDEVSPVDDGSPPGGKQDYGHQPFYMIQLQSKKFIGVLFLNSNDQDTVLVKNAITKGLNVYHKPIGGIFDVYYFYPGTAEVVMQKYHSLIGRPYVAPFWSLGFHQCRYGWENLKVVQNVVANFEQADIPLEVVWADIDYMKEYADFTIDPIRYGGLGDFVKELHKKTMRWVPIIDAGLKYDKDDPYYQKGEKNGAFIKSAWTRQTLIGKVWPGLAVFPDWMTPYATTLWQEGLDDLHTQAEFDGIWIDMNEVSNFCDGECRNITRFDEDHHLRKSSTRMLEVGEFGSDPHDPHEFDNLPYYPGGKDPSHKTLSMTGYHRATNDYEDKFYKEYNLHSIWPLEEAKATHNYFVEKVKERPFLLTRASFPGSGLYTSKWLGDNFATWEFLRYSIVGLYSFQMYGIPLVGADICGFIFDTTEELCARWMQVGSFYPFSRNHNDIHSKPQEPYIWEKVATASRNAIRQKYSILRYYYTKLFEVSLYGGSLVRPMFFEFPKDEKVYEKTEFTFMIGPALLVAPVLHQGLLYAYPYCPNENWYDAYSGAILYEYDPEAREGRQLTLSAGFDYVNVLLRGGNIIPFQDALGAKVRRTELLKFIPMEIIVALDHNGNAKGSLIVDEGDSVDPIGKKEYRHITLAYTGASKLLNVELLNDYPKTYNFEKFTKLSFWGADGLAAVSKACLLYTSPSPRDATLSRMPSSA
eukprot:TRINITY_DN4440_c0_g3_i2.p1 TRINITY_DN4440_c0_g3~~TRINITY_DN4440_c0_g3_i2.p1  ORF type:complete len:886 (+),score=154.41 TRINITY_DN4440_c0_g3_i2:58-2715(+)